MRIFSPYILLCLVLLSCKNDSTIQIPDQVPVSEKTGLMPIPGTRVWAYNPVGYHFVAELGRIQKDQNSTLQLKELIGTKYETRKDEIKKSIEQPINSARPEKPIYQKEFQMGDYKAFLFYGHTAKPAFDQMVMCFGNVNFVVTATAEFPNYKPQDRDSLLKVMLSLYIENQVQVDTTAVSNFTVDVSGTDFKYIGNSNQCDFYTLPGEGLPNSNPFQDIIFIRSFGPMEYDSLKKIADLMVNGYRNSIDISDLHDGQIMFNGFKANEISFTGTLQGKQCEAYQILVCNKKHTIIFFGTAFSRRESLMKQIRKIASTLKIKE